MHKLLAVGGSGQHVAATLTRLALLGAIPREWSITVIDADTNNDIFRNLQSADGWVSEAYGCKHPLGKTKLRTPYDQAARAAGEGGQTTVQSLILGDERGQTGGAVVNALFPESELRQKVDDGFYGRPMLGASAFGAMGSDLINGVRTDTATGRVVVAGSFIGGTGAGVLPALVEKCADPSRWSGVFLLNWLQLKDGTLAGNPLPANMAHGLEYFYRHIRSKLRRSALIGSPVNTFESASLLPTEPKGEGTESLSMFIAVAALHALAMIEDNQTDGVGQIETYQVATNNPRQVASAPVSRERNKSVEAVVRETRAAVALAEDVYSGTVGTAWSKSAQFLGRVFGEQDAIPSDLDAATKRLSTESGMHRRDLIEQCQEALKHRATAAARAADRLEATFQGAGTIRRTYAKPDKPSERIASAIATRGIKLPEKPEGPKQAPNILADAIFAALGFPGA